MRKILQGERDWCLKKERDQAHAPVEKEQQVVRVFDFCTTPLPARGRQMGSARMRATHRHRPAAI